VKAGSGHAEDGRLKSRLRQHKAKRIEPELKRGRTPALINGSKKRLRFTAQSMKRKRVSSTAPAWTCQTRRKGWKGVRRSFEAVKGNLEHLRMVIVLYLCLAAVREVWKVGGRAGSRELITLRTLCIGRSRNWELGMCRMLGGQTDDPFVGTVGGKGAGGMIGAFTRCKVELPVPGSGPSATGVVIGDPVRRDAMQSWLVTLAPKSILNRQDSSTLTLVAFFSLLDFA
jgi:hypothetical protein